jgi:tetratricopeptide (TPR) repeat protein
MGLFAVMASTLASYSASAFTPTSSVQPFSIAPYLEKCGGKIYSKCDSAHLNQGTIFDLGRAQAVNEGLDVMIVFGADWCPSCRVFSNMVKNDKDNAKLYSRFVVIEINGDLASGKALAKSLKLSPTGYPQAFILKAATSEMLQQLFPSGFTSVEALLSAIGPKGTGAVLSKPVNVGSILVSTLELPIELNGEYGHSSFVGAPKNKADMFINQGVAALQVYHYVDAFRSFHAAENLENSVMAQVGKILAIQNIRKDAAAEYFVNESLLKIESIAKTRQLSAAERAWFEFAKSVQMANSLNYLKVPGREVMPLEDAYHAVLENDKTNLDGHTLITWEAISVLDIGESKRFLRSVLGKLPMNIGAHHSLLHLAEHESDVKAANVHAVALARLAPRSAHAQHMYGHTLPQQGRWKEALALFKKADAIHHEWAAKYGLDVNQDWHYAHNLDLLAATYLGLGDFENARLYWSRSLDGRAILNSMGLAVATSKNHEADQLLSYYEKLGLADHLKSLRAELSLTRETAMSFTIQGEKVDGRATYAYLVGRIVDAFSRRQAKVEPALIGEINEYFTQRFKAGGFDGWSSSYLELLRIKRVAGILGMNTLLVELDPLEFAIRSGSLCGTSVEQKSLIPCIR